VFGGMLNPTLLLLILLEFSILTLYGLWDTGITAQFVTSQLFNSLNIIIVSVFLISVVMLLKTVCISTVTKDLSPSNCQTDTHGVNWKLSCLLENWKMQTPNTDVLSCYKDLSGKPANVASGKCQMPLEWSYKRSFCRTWTIATR